MYRFACSVALAVPCLQSDFITKVKVIRERMESKESETLGRWYTEEQLKKNEKFTASMVKSIVSYCKKFPESLIRLD